MLVTESKPIEEILGFLEGREKVFLAVCSGCPEACKTGGKEGMDIMQENLEKQGKSVVGTTVIDMMCNKALDWIKISRSMHQVEEADAILVLSCGVGVQAIGKVVDKPVHPALNTISVGGLPGLWPSEERCAACGECVLSHTGGICPITNCAKSLLNGPCGGTTMQGKCEIDAEKDCGWYLIYERLKKTGNLENLKKIVRTRDFSKIIPSAELRNTVFYNVEQKVNS